MDIKLNRIWKENIHGLISGLMHLPSFGIKKLTSWTWMTRYFYFNLIKPCCSNISYIYIYWFPTILYCFLFKLEPQWIEEVFHQTFDNVVLFDKYKLIADFSIIIGFGFYLLDKPNNSHSSFDLVPLSSLLFSHANSIEIQSYVGFWCSNMKITKPMHDKETNKVNTHEHLLQTMLDICRDCLFFGIDYRCITLNEILKTFRFKSHVRVVFQR